MNPDEARELMKVLRRFEKMIQEMLHDCGYCPECATRLPDWCNWYAGERYLGRTRACEKLCCPYRETEGEQPRRSA
jgi:threonine dehydrogenase-like Zn-dependent dehydrogenase